MLERLGTGVLSRRSGKFYQYLTFWGYFDVPAPEPRFHWVSNGEVAFVESLRWTVNVLSSSSSEGLVCVGSWLGYSSMPEHLGKLIEWTYVPITLGSSVMHFEHKVNAFSVGGPSDASRMLWAHAYYGSGVVANIKTYYMANVAVMPLDELESQP
jgi:hypothetical protein